MSDDLRAKIKTLLDEFVKGENEDIETYNSSSHYRQVPIEEKLAFAHHRLAWQGKCFAQLCALLSTTQDAG